MGSIAMGAVVLAWLVYRWLRRWDDPSWTREKQAGAFGWSKRGGGDSA